MRYLYKLQEINFRGAFIPLHRKYKKNSRDRRKKKVSIIRWKLESISSRSSKRRRCFHFFFSQANVSMSGGVSNYNWAAIQSRYQLGNGEGIGTSHCPRSWHNGHRRGRLSRSVISGGGERRDPHEFLPFQSSISRFRREASGSHGGGQNSHVTIKNDRFNCWMTTIIPWNFNKLSILRAFTN